MDKIESKEFKDYALALGQKLMELYWSPLYKYVEQNKHLIKTVTGLLLKHDKLVFYLGKTHLAVEYIGPERLDTLVPHEAFELICHDLTLTDENFIEQIVGFKFDSTAGIKFPLPSFAEDLIIPTNKGFDKLIELNWNFAAQNSMMAFNTGNFYISKGQFARHINSLYFDADENGLKTRHIKWIDFIPLEYDDSRSENDSIAINLNYYNENRVNHDAHYIYPLPDKIDFKFSKLPQINRFIELAGNKASSEPDITSFLEKDENKFILSMAFLAKEIHPQLTCKWQSETRNAIKPDFFIVQPNGYANIVEFKLPYLKSNSVTGKENRETFSAEINSYISQSRVYKTYFDDPNNRKWIEDNYGFKVFNPRRILVIGRRWDFNNNEWREIIADYKDIEIMTYEDLVDGVVAQFYL